MSKLIFFLFFLITSYATVPEAVLREVQTSGYAGYWVNNKYNFGHEKTREVDRYVYIDCDGSIKYSIKHPEALLYKEDNDDGKIIQLVDGKIKIKSWIGMEFNYNISKPEKQENGCTKIFFKGDSFQTYYPTDCQKPRKTFYEALDEAFDHLKKQDYVYCD
jgi:hypothetical protein